MVVVAVGKVEHGKVTMSPPCQDISLAELNGKLVCSHCGDTHDVIMFAEYVGGQGFVQVPKCRDRFACWDRWDKSHGLDCGMAELIRERDERSLLSFENGHCDG